MKFWVPVNIRPSSLLLCLFRVFWELSVATMAPRVTVVPTLWPMVTPLPLTSPRTTALPPAPAHTRETTKRLSVPAWARSHSGRGGAWPRWLTTTPIQVAAETKTHYEKTAPPKKLFLHIDIINRAFILYNNKYINTAKVYSIPKLMAWWSYTCGELERGQLAS